MLKQKANFMKEYCQYVITSFGEPFPLVVEEALAVIHGNAMSIFSGKWAREFKCGVQCGNVVSTLE